MATTDMIRFENVKKIYTGLDAKSKDIVALHNVNLSIKKGEFVFVLGHSGAGKSTFLKLILREEAATEGKVFVNGRDLSSIRQREIPYLRRGLGVVFQDFRLIPTMTAYENVAFAMRVTNIPERQIKRRVPYVLNLVGLAGKAHSLPQELCKKDRKRAVKILKRTEGLKHRQAAEVFLLIEYVDRQRPNTLQLQQKRIMHMSGKVVQR